MSRQASSSPNTAGKRKATRKTSPVKRCDEYTLQKDCINWLKSDFPTLKNRFTATVGGARLASGPASYAKLRASGYLPGIPDVLIFKAQQPYHGLFIELKTARGVVSETQATVHAALRSEGYCVVVVRSFDAFKKAVHAYLQGPYIAAAELDHTTVTTDIFDASCIHNNDDEM